MSRLMFRGGSCLAVLACLVGCSGGSHGDRPKTVPVTGTVTHKGSPVEGAAVTFSPSSKSGSASIGTTDAQGNFTLKSPWGSAGAVPGSYGVTVVKTQAEGGGEEPTEAKVEEGAATKLKEQLPAKYNSPATSKLTAEVKTEGKNEFKFELTD